MKSLTKVLEMRAHIDQGGTSICAGTEFAITTEPNAAWWQANTAETVRRDLIRAGTRENT
ncbi:hypothetical protein IT072_03190 [Leifsonia sp. ZF2019]|uniref:hypothetical protein n=1 Tax=Leifsonia sp. ZF2019 TaxID=2781978 RepID=UPI001CBED391|nr:hypothetical protein [Leifsonia sp. ZF2019]UAJ80081.1 hypothetical protein IT072_03190 [Leifsonia sp. ZF2019]